MGSQTPSDHFVDIHRDGLPERQTFSGPIPKPAGHRGSDRRGRKINRQVSLETGFAVLNMPNASGSRERKALPRSGESLGAVNYSGGDVGLRKGDFSMFRTKSTLIKQNSLMPQRKESEFDVNNHGGEGAGGGGGSTTGEGVNESVPAGRYFAALRGPELDQVKDSEDILLPKDQLWPFLLRFPINCFGICLGLGSQAILWRNLSTSHSTAFLHVSPNINLIIWMLALAVLVSVSITYALKCVFYFEAVRREYFHPIRINFFFAPWIACMFLAIGVPQAFTKNTADPLHPSIWCIFIVPLFLLELKIYGQWLSGGKRRLCKVANPSSHLSVVGNFVGAILAANCGWREAGKFLWAIGLAHYLVVFVTLYQRLPTNEALPKELHPVYSMFIATPSAASIAWKAIYGDFDAVSRTFYFIALFLFTSLVVRINFFRGFKFSVAWWSYTFPMTTVSLATIKYAEEVPCFFTKGLALSLTVLSSTIVSLLLVSTLLHAFVWRSLFPNDLAIAITKNKATGARSSQAKEKRPAKKAYDIKRWAKQSIVTAIAKSNSAGKDTEEK
ncbi:putative guard cell S-type anion channel SLAC1 [Iris pallida]|uniref:Guard cell S-type anion channel SLAC1 n=1 Tax=Iris pallida TaxID=29817 RepID=A0AAX6HGL0_IRIPA|nr:putative guard cell S-type anion channel SLAC1 [Iris pallida]